MSGCFVVKNPGIHLYNPLVAKAVEKGLPTVYKIEIAQRVMEQFLLVQMGKQQRLTLAEPYVKESFPEEELLLAGTSEFLLPTCR